MKSYSLALFLALALLPPAFGKTFKVPDEESFASITIPDAWKAKEIDKGVEAQSPDGEVWFAVEGTDAKGLDKTIEEAVDFLKEKGVTVDLTTQKQSSSKLNGMDTTELDWKGTDKDGAAEISLSVIAINSDHALLVTYWASPEGTKKHISDLGDIVNSIKAIK